MQLQPPLSGAQQAQELRLPDFFIVGQPKCGTTALYHMLRSHPQVFMPDNKEPWFFAQELLERTPPRSEGTPRTLDQYAQLFAGAGPEQRAGEASVLYLWSRTAPGAIAETVPDARIIAILREPASLLRSLHVQFLESYVETETDLRTALALEPERARGRRLPAHTYWPRALLYSEHVRYVDALERYREHFSEQNMLVLIYDDFRADNAAVARQVLQFLDLDDSVALRRTEANPTVAVRPGIAGRLLHPLIVGRGPLVRPVKGLIRAALPNRLRRAAAHSARHRLLYTEPGPPDEALMAQLRAQYRPEVERLSAYLGRDLLAQWGYE